MEKEKPVAVVVGAGPGDGAALARRFVEAGYATAILSRHRSTLAPIEDELADTRGFECDVSDPTSVESTFARIRSELGEVSRCGAAAPAAWRSSPPCAAPRRG